MTWILLIGVGFAFYYFYNNKNKLFHSTSDDSSEELLNRRFVKGEIDEETYLKMKETLKRR